MVIIIIFSFLAWDNIKHLTSVFEIDSFGDNVVVCTLLDYKRAMCKNIVPNVVGHIVIPDLVLKSSIFEDDEVFIEAFEKTFRWESSGQKCLSLGVVIPELEDSLGVVEWLVSQEVVKMDVEDAGLSWCILVHGVDHKNLRLLSVSLNHEAVVRFHQLSSLSWGLLHLLGGDSLDFLGLGFALVCLFSGDLFECFLDLLLGLGFDLFNFGMLLSGFSLSC